MTLVNIFSNFIKNLKSFNKKKDKQITKTNKVSLENNISKFTYISCAISSKNIEIIQSKDNIGGYLNNKLLLPEKISISKKKNINYLIYIYKIKHGYIYISQLINNKNTIGLTNGRRS